MDGQPLSILKDTISGLHPHMIELGDAIIELPIRHADPCRPVKFAVLGDGRAHRDHLGPSAYWPGLLREIKAHNPAFILNTGDLVKRGTRDHEWRRYLAQTPAWPPMIAIRGNHDRGEIFGQIQAVTEPVYWFRWGPVLIIGISTEGSDEGLDVIKSKLSEVLKKHQAPWRIVFMHRPVWSRGHHGSNERGWNRHLVSIFDRHQVDLVLAGHDHNYERFCPSRGIDKERKCVSSATGTTYIVTGGAATFTNPIPGLSSRVTKSQAQADRSASRIFSGANHFLTIHASEGELTLLAHRSRVGNFQPRRILDQITLRRGRRRCPKDTR